MNGTKPTEYAVNLPEIADAFYTLAVTIDRALATDEIARVSGCLGYALRATLAGEDLSDPETITIRHGQTRITYAYDSTKSRRDDPDYEGALRSAGAMIMTGSPVRTTNRAGAGTAGTRLVEGIGLCAVTFEVDFDSDPEPTPPAAQAAALAELDAARDALNAAQQAYAQAAINYAGVSA